MHYVDDETGMVDTAEVERCLERILAYLDEKGDFSLHFIPDTEMRDLNREYRGKDEPTDILTFALCDGFEFPEVEGEEKELGDIFISVDSMRRNAESLSVPENEELRRLLVHGILHLRGMDHATNDFAAEPMLREQERIMAELGLLFG